MAKRKKSTETQKMIDGTDTRIPVLEEAGGRLLDRQDKKAGSIEKLREAEATMLAAMKDANVLEYKINGFRFKRETTDEKVSVKKIPVGKTG